MVVISESENVEAQVGYEFSLMYTPCVCKAVVVSLSLFEEFREINQNRCFKYGQYCTLNDHFEPQNFAFAFAQ